MSVNRLNGWSLSETVLLPSYSGYGCGSGYGRPGRPWPVPCLLDCPYMEHLYLYMECAFFHFCGRHGRPGRPPLLAVCAAVPEMDVQDGCACAALIWPVTRCPQTLS